MGIFDVLSEATGYMPWQIEDAASDVFNAVPGILKTVGTLSPLLTSSQDIKRAATPQFATRPMSLQLEDLQALTDWINSNTQSMQMPTRRLTPMEAGDEIFAPKAVQYLQEFFDAQEAASSPKPEGQAQRPDRVTTQPQVNSYAAIDDFKRGGTAPDNIDSIAADDDAIARLLQVIEERNDPFAPHNLPGYDPEKQTYHTKFGSRITGEAALKAARQDKEKALVMQAEQMMNPRNPMLPQGRPQYSSYDISQFIGGWTNPHTGYNVEVEKALDALVRGDLKTYTEVATLAHQDPTKRSWVDIAAPIVAAGIAAPLGAAAGGAIASGVGALPWSTTANLASGAGKYAARKAVGAAI